MKETEAKIEQVKLDGEAKIATITSQNQQTLKKWIFIHKN